MVNERILNKEKVWKEKRVIKTYSDEYYNEEVRAALNNWEVKKVKREERKLIPEKKNYLPLIVILAIITLVIGAYFLEPTITGFIVGIENPPLSK